MENPTTIPVGAEATLSYGQKAVGLNFNPGGDKKVSHQKILYAGVIDALKQELDKEPTYGVEGDTDMHVYSERGQLLIEAIRQAQTAQMWAVKAITFGK